MPTQEIDAAFIAGAALAALDAIVRTEPPWGGVWRHRLALAAAAASVRLTGRSEDAAALRDAFYLRRPGDDPGPAGRQLLGWRRLVRRSADFSEATILEVAEALGLKSDAALHEVAAAAAAMATHPRPAAILAAEIAVLTVERRPGGEILALWLADAVLANSLRWPVALPLLADQIHHPILRADPGERRFKPGSETWLRACCIGYARAAAKACDLAADLARRAQTLQAAAPKLRAKGAGAVIDRLLDDDALTPAARIGKMTDRGLRRLFDRLVLLGAVRELSGRDNFRLYGL